MSIVLEDVCYVYSPRSPMETEVLHGINLAIADGDFVGIIGHTGSGKSTLIQHFNGLLKPASGRVIVDDMDLQASTVSLKSIRQRVGMVFQYPEHQLFGETVFEDVAFGPRNLGLSEDEVTERVEAALAMVDLEFGQVHQRSPFELSGGQKRRVAIAGVLAMRPSTLILDEPSAGLDPQGRAEILGQVQRLHESWKLTVVLVTHSMEDIARLATRVVVLDHGRIALEGAPREVFQQMDLLRKIGLDVPQIASLMFALQKRGQSVRTDVLTIEEAEEELLKLMELGRCGQHV